MVQRPCVNDTARPWARRTAVIQPSLTDRLGSRTSEARGDSVEKLGPPQEIRRLRTSLATHIFP